MSLKVISVFGTRPEAIKMAPLVKELEKHESFDSVVAVTAQHREMLDSVLKHFKIVPKYDMNVMKENQSISYITAKVLTEFEMILKNEKPDIILVHGDTTTTLAASLAAFYCKIKVGHVEAGLRTNDKWFPYPEEINRKLTGGLADIHFSPTANSKKNLIKEGINEKSIFITGNTVIDSMKDTVIKDYSFNKSILENLDYNKRIILVTAHRRENLGKPMENICLAIKDIVSEFDDIEVVFPVHFNPMVRKVVNPILRDVKRVNLIEPLDTLDMHNLMNKAYFILTDSGGLQEEAPALGKPVLVLREVTERPEGVKAGTVKVVGTTRENIANNSKELLKNRSAYNKMAEAINPYGDGLAATRIAKALLYYFNLNEEKPLDFVDYSR